MEAEKVLLPAIEGCINARALKAFRKNLPVVRSTLDHRSAIGAFALVKRAMLNGTLLQRLLELIAPFLIARHLDTGGPRPSEV